MAKTNALPTSLLEAVRYFSDIDVATEFVAKLRWPDGPVCPSCGGAEYSYLTTRRLWKCKNCKKQYSVKVGTIFEDSALGLDKWLPAVWLIANSKNGISSHELARALNTTQKSAWFMLHRIRLAMRSQTFEMLSGHVEADETYIGGKARNMKKGQRIEKTGEGRSTANKTPVLGMVERGGKVKARVVEDVKRTTLQSHVRDAVKPGSTLYTDALPSYTGLERDYNHLTVNHAVTYVDGQVHTNVMENFWSLLKRGLHGTYISVQPYHLFRYLDERAFTFNMRELTDLGRFTAVLSAVSGRRLTYDQLTGR
ncbi:MAG: IS1595 family transposase [Actinomycetota bacterium]|nr:IS1595 family transposase [Actinomycetota bacterium]